MKTGDFWILSFILLIFAGIMFQISGDYGISRDEPDYFFVGERDFHYLLTGNPALLDHYYYDGKYDFEAKDHPFFRTRLFGRQPPPFAYILSAASCTFFYRILGWFNPLEAHRLINKVFMLILVVSVFYFTRGVWGRRAAYLSILFLIFFPRLFGEVFMNEKDVPHMALFAWTLLSFWKGIDEERGDWLILSSLLFGFALGTKMNAFFIPVIIGLWFFFGFGREGKSLVLSAGGLMGVFSLSLLKGIFWFGKDRPIHLNRGLWTLGEIVEKRLYPFLIFLDNGPFYGLLAFSALAVLCGLFLASRSHLLEKIKGTRRLYVPLLLYPFIALGTFFSVYPHLWADPLHRFLAYLYFYVALQGGISVLAGHGIGAAGPWDGLYYFLVTSPVVPMFFSFLGIFFVLKAEQRWKKQAGWLVIFWFSIPILRASLPGMDNEGVRHFLEFVPGFCILAGVGLDQTIAWIKGAVHFEKAGKWGTTGLIGLAYLPAIFSIARLHPYEHVYFNSLIGGLKGALKQKEISNICDYWGTSYKEGLSWINQNAAPDAWVVVPIYSHLFNLAPLRQDLHLVNLQRYKEEIRSIENLSHLAEKYPMYVMYVTRGENYKQAKYSPEFFAYFENQTPMHVVARDGIPLLKIFRVHH